MYVKMLALFSVVFAFVISSCAPKQSDIVVSEFGNNQIKMREFENAYVKNAGSLEQAEKDSLSQLKNFLNLYTDFKMKIRDAEVRGFDQDTSLQNELADYKNKIGVTYLLNKEIVDPGIKDLYNKRKYELRISHIMFRPDSTGDANAEKLANAVLDSIKNGASFEEMAKKYSQDIYSRPAGGDIYYLTGGILPESFENAAYATEPGHVYPHVVRTKYGFHLIKITDKRERVPQIRASHILIGFNDAQGKMDTAAARAKIDSILTKIKNGADFAEMAKEYSQDPGSKDKGGDLGFFERRQMVKEFDEAAFNLKIGEVSGIIKTRFGYHIIKITDKKNYPTFDQDKEELKNIFQKSRYQEKYDSLIAKLKAKYDFKMVGKTLDFIASNSDSSVVGNDSALVAKTAGMVIYSFTGYSRDASQFLSALDNMKDYIGKLINLGLLKNGIDKESKEKLLEKEAGTLDKTDSVYASLINDYKNGIYIFKLQTDEVWNKINTDSTKMHQFYDEHKNNYMWPNRVSYNYISFETDSAAEDAYSKLKSGDSFNSLGGQNARYSIKEENLQNADASVLSRAANGLDNPGDYSKPVMFQKTYYIVRLKDKEPSRVKTFEEAKAEVSSGLQDQEAKTLENNYIERLKNLYKPVYHYDELTKAFKTN